MRLHALFLRGLRATVPLAAGAALAFGLPTSTAVLAAAGLAAALPAVGAGVLRRAAVGEISWRNHLAGWLIPFGWRLGRGRLPATTVVCGVIWFALAVIGVLGTKAALAPPGPAAGTPSTATNLALFAAWIVDGAAAAYLLGVQVQHFSPSSGSGRRLLGLVAVIGVLLAASVLLHLGGRTGLAALVAGGPPLALGVLYGGFVLVMLTAGRNARWN